MGKIFEKKYICIAPPLSLFPLPDSKLTHEVEINHEDSPEPLPNITEALKRYYRDYFADWFEPNQQMNRLEGGGIRR